MILLTPALSGICSLMLPKKSVKIQKRRINLLMESTMEQFALGGCKVKEFVIEGDGEEGIEEKNLLSNSVFGYYWDPASINMKMIISLNLSKKKRSVRILPAIVKDDVEIYLA